MDEKVVEEFKRDPRNLNLSNPQEDIPWCDSCGVYCECGWSTLYREVNDEIHLIKTLCVKCDDMDKMKRYEKDNIITTRLMMLAALRGVEVRHGVEDSSDSNNVLNKIIQSNDVLESLSKVFEYLVWYKGVQKQVKKSEVKGLSAKYQDISCLLWACAGRVMITFRSEDDSYISLMTLEDSTDIGIMGLHGINSTEEKAVSMIMTIIEGYSKGLFSFVKDCEVSLAF